MSQLGCVVSVLASHHGRGATGQALARGPPPLWQALAWEAAKLLVASIVSCAALCQCLGCLGSTTTPRFRKCCLSSVVSVSASHGSSPARLGTPEFPLVLSQLGCVVSVSASHRWQVLVLRNALRDSVPLFVNLASRRSECASTVVRSDDRRCTCSEGRQAAEWCIRILGIAQGAARHPERRHRGLGSGTPGVGACRAPTSSEGSRVPLSSLRNFQTCQSS